MVVCEDAGGCLCSDGVAVLWDILFVTLYCVPSAWASVCVLFVFVFVCVINMYSCVCVCLCLCMIVCCMIVFVYDCVLYDGIFYTKHYTVSPARAGLPST